MEANHTPPASDNTVLTPETNGSGQVVDEKHTLSPPMNGNTPAVHSKHGSGQNALSRFFSKMGDLPEIGMGGKKLEGRTLNWSIGIIASCGFLMFGYDQGVMSALLTLDDFQKVLPLMTPLEESNYLCYHDYPANNDRDEAMCTGTPNTQAAAVAIYQIGCFLGAVVVLFYGERWGRKSSTFWGSLVMIIGTIMQAATFSYGLFVAGRIVGGVGNGIVTSSRSFSPHRECSPVR